MSSLLPVVIDRIAMNRAIPTKLNFKLIRDKLYMLKKEGSHAFPKGKITLSTSNYESRINIYPFDVPTGYKRKIADIRIGACKNLITKMPHYYLVFTLYPTKLLPGEFQMLEKLLEVFYPYSYADFYFHGRVSYIELAVDDTAHSHESFLIYSKYTRFSSACINEDKTVGTTYLGNRKSPKLIRKYDKKKQLLETGSIFSTPHPILTRIEASLRHPRLSPADLLELTNPFKNVYVVDMDAARAFSKSPVWQQFLDRCPSKGIPGAYPLTPALRKLCRKQLDGLHAPWWDSSEIWKSYPQALQVLIPTPHADGFKPKKVTELAQA